MSQPESSLRNRKEYPPRGPEDKIRTEIASSLLLLNMSTLETLKNHGKPEDYDAFHALIRDHDGSFKNADFPENLGLRWRVKRYVRTLSIDAVDEITTRPIDSGFYREVIYLMLSNIESAGAEEWAIRQDGEPSPGIEDAARDELENIVNILRTMSRHLRDAVAKGYLPKTVDPLKERLRSIDHNVEDACSSLQIDHQPLITTDDANEK